MTRDVVVLSAVRTGIGRFGGGLSDVPLTELASTVTRAAVQRSGVQPQAVEHVVFGNVIHTDPADMYLARVAALHAALPVGTPAFGVNRLCRRPGRRRPDDRQPPFVGAGGATARSGV